MDVQGPQRLKMQLSVKCVRKAAKLKLYEKRKITKNKIKYNFKWNDGWMDIEVLKHKVFPLLLKWTTTTTVSTDHSLMATAVSIGLYPGCSSICKAQMKINVTEEVAKKIKLNEIETIKRNLQK